MHCTAAIGSTISSQATSSFSLKSVNASRTVRFSTEPGTLRIGFCGCA
jgi:hypothetical protein